MKPITGDFKVALITPGPVSDAGWSAMAYEGLKGIQEATGAKIANEVAGGAKIKDSMRSFAQDGYQLIIGHGFEYNEPAIERRPKIRFPTLGEGCGCSGTPTSTIVPSRLSRDV